MTHPNDERDERVTTNSDEARIAQIRKRYRKGYNYGPENEQMEDDIGVLLSLLDSQAATLQWSKKAPTTDGFYWWRMAPTDGDTFDVVRVVKGKVYDIGDSVGIAVSQYVGEWLGPITPMVTFDAATRMRDLCVTKMEELRDERIKELHVFANDDNHADDAEYTRAVLFVLHGAISAIKSLTLEQEQEKSNE